MIEFVGGPVHGRKIERPTTGNIRVPVRDETGQFGVCHYTLRRTWDAHGNVVEVLAPAGRQIDPAWLAAHKLRN
jgi:hypothetical protein